MYDRNNSNVVIRCLNSVWPLVFGRSIAVWAYVCEYVISVLMNMLWSHDARGGCFLPSSHDCCLCGTMTACLLFFHKNSVRLRWRAGLISESLFFIIPPNSIAARAICEPCRCAYKCLKSEISSSPCFQVSCLQDRLRFNVNLNTLTPHYRNILNTSYNQHILITHNLTPPPPKIKQKNNLVMWCFTSEQVMEWTLSLRQTCCSWTRRVKVAGGPCTVEF